MSARESPLATTSSPLQGEARRLRNYVGGEWVEPSGETGSTTSTRRAESSSALVPLSGSGGCGRAVAAARAAQPEWRGVAPQRRARAVMALREALWANREEIAALVTEDMGKTLDDAGGEVLRGIESTEAACGDPPPAEGREARGGRERRRRRPGPPAGRRRRRDHAVQLPGDDPPLVPPLRDRVRQHVRPQAVGARPAALGADLRAHRRRSTRSRAASATSCTARATRSTACSTTRRWTRSRSSARRRPPGTSPSARRPPASGARRSAAPRTPGRDARRRPRGDRAGDHGIRVRRRRAAMPRGLGRGAGRRRGPPGRGPRGPRDRRRRAAGRSGADADTDVCPMVGARGAGADRRRDRSRRGRGAEMVLDGRGDDRAGRHRCSARRSSRPPTPSPRSPARSCSARC